MELATIICKTCGNNFSGKYCNICGEKVYTNRDKTLAHFFEEVLHFIIHLDGTFFRTVKTLFTKPGQLSKDFSDGIRKPYFKPLSLFLLLVIIYLLFPFFEGLNMQLKYYMQNRVYGQFASEQVNRVLQQQHVTESALAELFHHKAEKVSKFLLLIILPLTALFFWLFTFKKRKYFFDQMVFSTEINNIFLLWGFMALPLLLMVFVKVYHFFSGHYLSLTDGPVGIIMYSVLCLYVVIAARRFYSVKKWYAIILGLLFYFVHIIVLQGVYKFLLFVIVINQIN